MLRIQAEASFEGVLRRISDEERDPTPWEGECLRAALMMMAMEDYGSARETLKASKLAPKEFADVKCGFSIEDFTNLLTVLKAHPPCFTESLPRKPAQSRPPALQRPRQS